MEIPYFDLTRQNAGLSEEVGPVLNRLMASGRFILGKAVEDFESHFAAYCGTRYAVGVGSGTDALSFSLRALNITKGDEVILPSFTFVATALAVVFTGARPVFADIDPETYTLNPVSVQKLLTRRTRALLPVHLYGHLADMEELCAFARKKKLVLVEDACQAHGATWEGRKAGSFGELGCFSFYPTKNLGAFGDGGMVVTDNQKLAEKIRCYRNLGRPVQQGPHRVIGWTSRLDALQAALLDIKLKHLEAWNEKRRRIASLYRQLLGDLPLILPSEKKGYRHVFHLFVVRVPDGRRDSLQAYLAEGGVRTMIHYPLPVHRQPALRAFRSSHKGLPVTERLSREILSLPMFPEMSEEETAYVCELIRRFYRKAA